MRRIGTAIAAAFDSIAPMYQSLEDELAGKDYLAGSYSIADIVFTPNLARPIELGVGLPEKFPRIRAWVERLMRRPSFRSIQTYVSQHQSCELAPRLETGRQR